MIVFKCLKGVVFFKDRYLIILNILIVVTIVDSLLRSVLVDFFGIFFLGLSLILNRIK